MADEDNRCNPYPGLRAFEPDEDHLFFGREKQTDDLLWRLREHRFLPMIGAPGSGKSSLVHAGVIPSLFSGFMLEAGSSWRVARLTPGCDPIGNLAAALLEHGVVEELGDDCDLHRPLLETTLRSSALGLVKALRQTRIPPRDNVLVVVDQLEELFRYRHAPGGSRDEAAAFVKLLVEAAGQEEVPIYVAVTLRSEFLEHCARYPGLTSTINRGAYLVPHLNRDELKQAITGPARVAGGAVAPRLVTRLLNDAGDDPDHLGLLQHALMRMWDRAAPAGEGSAGEPLDLEHYEAVGTMAEALPRHAEETLADLPDAKRGIAEALLEALARGTAARWEQLPAVRLGEICERCGAAEDEVLSVIEHFSRPGRSFLVPPAGASAGGGVVDLTHDAVIRRWPRLRARAREKVPSARPREAEDVEALRLEVSRQRREIERLEGLLQASGSRTTDEVLG